jgi:hypothetical protein
MATFMAIRAIKSLVTILKTACMPWRLTKCKTLARRQGRFVLFLSFIYTPRKWFLNRMVSTTSGIACDVDTETQHINISHHILQARRRIHCYEILAPWNSECEDGLRLPPGLHLRVAKPKSRHVRHLRVL